MWTWEVVVSVVLALLGLGIMAGQDFTVNASVLVFWASAGVLMLVRFLHREPQISPTPIMPPRPATQLIAEELSRLRAYGLHHIRNEYEANPHDLNVYIAREVEWRAQLQAAMEHGGCPSADISRVMDITFSEIGRAAAGANYGPDGNWLIGVMEMRLNRLAELINEYKDD